MRKKQKSRHRQKPGKKKQRRNRRFWRQVIENRYTRIFEFARRFTKNISDANDLAQTVVWRLLKYSPKPVRVVNLDAYIWASTRNAALDLRKAQKEINFSDLRKTDSPQLAVPDPNINKFMAECDVKALAPKITATTAKALQRRALVLQIRILKEAGHNLPEIAKRLNQPIRRVRHYWYQERQALRKGLQGSGRRVAKVSGAQSRRPARGRRAPANAPIEDVP
jgi:DNA-directed RNA polymerase specialized sigma24 family protein